MSEALDHILKDQLNTLKDKGLYRRARAFGPSSEGHIQLNQRDMLNFSSNNYMGLAQHPVLIARAVQWAQDWGAGATASRLVCGTMELHEQIEEKLLRHKGGEAALLFNSGFQANAAILSALFDKSALGLEPLVFCDRLNHASMHFGLKSAGIRQIRYRHNDLNHLEDLLVKNQSKKNLKFIVTESVFSMDGDRSDIDGLIRLADTYGASLYVDEAHATGVLGQKGYGLCAHKAVDFKMGTFSKALGGFGSYLICSKTVRDYLVNRCSGFIYSTALPPATLGAMDAALDLVATLDQERNRLLKMAEQVRRRFHQAGWQTGESSTQIIPLMVGSAEQTRILSDYLEEAGILGIAIRPPTVPQGTSRIRFALSAAHSDQDIARLCDVIDQAPLVQQESA